ncbi:MAG: FUSC family protein, partial [Burkholderiales bacterium]
MALATGGRRYFSAARILALVREELAPLPGRMDTVWRYVVASAIVIVISMALQVPSLALSLIVVFFTAQENTVMTRMAGVVLMVGVTISIMLALLLLQLTIDHPFWRFLGIYTLLFCGMYFMRISKLGTLGYVLALVIVSVQSMVDADSDPESITRSVLWTWVVWVYPIIVTIIVNQLLLPANPGRLLNDELARQLDEVYQQLDARKTQSAAPRLSLGAIERGILSLHRHLSFATRGNSSYWRNEALHLMRITAVDRLHTAAGQLSQLPANEATQAQRDMIDRLQAACRNLQLTIRDRQRFVLAPGLIDANLADGVFDTVLQEMAHAVHALAEAESPLPPTPPAAKASLIAADALSNPAYAQFALKTVLATLLCYLFCSATQWPGINTAMLTCVILALPSVGAGSHKGVLRILGCVLGSIVALFAAVFVIPYLDSITGLLLLTLPVIAAGAWIAAGSARTNYIGVQLAFAFALASLSGFGPTIDLTRIRDRLIGILIGVAVSVFISSTIWPEREGSTLRTMLARLLRS